jgi:hypothetical protein
VLIQFVARNYSVNPEEIRQQPLLWYAPVTVEVFRELWGTDEPESVKPSADTASENLKFNL